MSDHLVHKCKGSHECHAKNHVCQIIMQKDLERIKKVVKDPHYFCKNCGRAAHDAENLCDPSKLD